MLVTQKSGKLTHEYESGRTGGNRFATILLYMSDLNENDGGETVFPHGEPTHVPEEDRVTKREVRHKTRSRYLFRISKRENICEA